MPSKTAELPSTTDAIDEPPKPIPKKSADKSQAKKPNPVLSYKNANSKLDRGERLAGRLANKEELTTDEYEFLSGELGWSRNEQERQVRRVAGIANLQKVAGTKAGLLARKKKLADLAGDSNEKLEQLAAQAAAIMDEHDKIAMGVRELESEIQASETAIKDLRSRVPAYVVRIYDQMIGQLKSSELNREKNELEQRVVALRGLPTSWNTHDAACIQAVIRQMPESERPGLLDNRGRVHLTRWNEFAIAKRTELPSLEIQLEKLEIQFEKKMRAADLLLDFYLT